MRVSRSFLKLVLILVAFAGISFVTFTNRLELTELYLERAQVISDDYGTMLFVPGSGCNPGVGTQERLDLAARFYQVKPRKVLISEGICPPEEQLRFRAYMQDSLRIDLKDVTWMAVGASTEENAQDCARYCAEHQIDEFILCTSSFHQARMKLHLNREGLSEFKVAGMPEELKKYKKLEPYRSRQGKRLTRELLAFFKAKWFR